MSKRTYTGKVTSAKMQNTVVVAVEIPKKHKIYGKSLKSTKKFLAHQEIGVKAGDIVRIEESRPYSKNTSWLVVEKVEIEKGKK